MSLYALHRPKNAETANIYKQLLRTTDRGLEHTVLGGGGSVSVLWIYIKAVYDGSL